MPLARTGEHHVIIHLDQWHWCSLRIVLVRLAIRASEQFALMLSRLELLWSGEMIELLQ